MLSARLGLVRGMLLGQLSGGCFLLVENRRKLLPPRGAGRAESRIRARAGRLDVGTLGTDATDVTGRRRVDSGSAGALGDRVGGGVADGFGRWASGRRARDIACRAARFGGNTRGCGRMELRLDLEAIHLCLCGRLTATEFSGTGRRGVGGLNRIGRSRERNRRSRAWGRKRRRPRAERRDGSAGGGGRALGGGPGLPAGDCREHGGAWHGLDRR
ncbi:MAG TPA: hypothetical protein VIT65_26280 [Microlunatus sp.]